MVKPCAGLSIVNIDLFDEIGFSMIQFCLVIGKDKSWSTPVTISFDSSSVWLRFLFETREKCFLNVRKRLTNVTLVDDGFSSVNVGPATVESLFDKDSIDFEENICKFLSNGWRKLFEKSSSKSFREKAIDPVCYDTDRKQEKMLHFHYLMKWFWSIRSWEMEDFFST